MRQAVELREAVRGVGDEGQDRRPGRRLGVVGERPVAAEEAALGRQRLEAEAGDHVGGVHGQAPAIVTP